jgi:hypothetical protein
MASLTVDTTQAAPVVIHEMSGYPGMANVAIEKGQVIRFNTAGKWVLADGTTATNAGNRRYIAGKTVAAGFPLTGYRLCIFDLGVSALDGLNHDAPIYLSDTPGELTAVVGESTTATIVGYVTPAFAGGSTTADRLLEVL